MGGFDLIDQIFPLAEDIRKSIFSQPYNTDTFIYYHLHK